MSGAIPLISLYAFVACTGIILPFLCLKHVTLSSVLVGTACTV